MKLMERLSARRQRRHPEPVQESAVEVLLRSLPTQAPAREQPSRGLDRRRRRFRYTPGFSRAAGGFHLPQRDHGSQPIRPMAWEQIEPRREANKARRRKARQHAAWAREYAHACRIESRREARCSRSR